MQKYVFPYFVYYVHGLIFMCIIIKEINYYYIHKNPRTNIQDLNIDFSHSRITV